MKKRLFIVLIILIAGLTVFLSACGNRRGDGDDDYVSSTDNLIKNGSFVKYDELGDIIIETSTELQPINWIRSTPQSMTLPYERVMEDISGKGVVPVYKNTQYKTGLWSEYFPEGWKVKTSDPHIASLSGFDGTEARNQNPA